MRLPVRIALVVVGLATAVYGTASLTGGWLGTPPWSCHEVEVTLGCGFKIAPDGTKKPFSVRSERDLGTRSDRRVDGAVVALGLAIAAFGAWPRRRASLAS